jgi:hypothetical protein
MSGEGCTGGGGGQGNGCKNEVEIYEFKVSDLHRCRTSALSPEPSAVDAPVYRSPLPTTFSFRHHERRMGRAQTR